MLRTKRPANLSAKLAAFAFQQAAVEALKDKEYGAIFHEQGLGKTKIGIDIALYWLENGIVDSVVIVSKRGLVSNWDRELKNHSYINPRILTQDRRSNYYAFNSPSPIYLTHYEVLAGERSRFGLFLKTRRVGILLDEAQKIKNPAASLTKAIQSLSSQFKRRLILTGTPIANRPYDIWSQIFFLDEGKSLGTDFTSFRMRLDLANELSLNAHRRDIFEEELSGLFARIAPFTVRETKATAGIELPEKTFENVYCDLEERQAQIYGNYRDELQSIIVKEALPIVDEAEGVLKRLLRLVQVASNPSMLDQSYRRVPGKMASLLGILHKALDQGEKVIVWTTFVDNSAWLARELDDLGTVLVNGNVDVVTRDERLSRFREDPSVRILVATPGAAKEGLTLTVANHAIFFDRSFSLDDYLQAQDRIHRISQTRTCFIYNLIARETVDEWVDILIAAKQVAAQLAQGDISGDQFRSKMSYDFGAAVRRILNLEEE